MSETRKSTNYDGLVLWAIIVFLAWGLGGLLVNWVSGGGETARGTFGDMFGAVNALFSGFAFAGLIYTIRQQKEGLELQQEELKETRKELAGQREQMESQATTLKLQQFESTFFQLLRVHGDIVGAIDLVKSSTNHTTKGRDCFKTFVERLQGIINKRMMSAPTDLKALESMFEGAYSRFYMDHEAEVGHYFRHLYHVIKFVDASEEITSIEDKRRYTSFVRAQLSANELTLLFHNCLSDVGRVKFKPLVEKYGLLKHLPRAVFEPKHRLFAPGAYLPANPTDEELKRIGAADVSRYADDNWGAMSGDISLL